MNNLKLCFSKAAKNYDEASEVQQLAAQELQKISESFIKENQKILDLGSGTSFLAKNFSAKKNLKIFEIDLALEMLQSWTERPKNIFAIQGNFEKLPFKKSQFDVIISSFSLQWLENFEENFSYFFLLLKPNGILAFCLPADGSLNELKMAKIFGFNQLPKVENIKAALKKSGFEEEKFSEIIFKQNFENGLTALKSLKKTGANHLQDSRKFISKKQLEEFNSFCLKNCDLKSKNFSLSWVVPYFIFSKK